MNLPKQINHTPGPWKLDALDRTLVLSAANEEYIADVKTGNERDCPDATLIAAAPALFAALVRMLEQHDAQMFICGDDDRAAVYSMLNQARAALSTLKPQSV